MEQSVRDTDQYAAYIYKFIQKYIQLSEAELNRYLPYVEVRQFKKREVILQYGQVENYLNLVVKGLVRKYTQVGKLEKTLQLSKEGQLIQSEMSFHTRIPSSMITEALEPSILVSMRYEHIQYAVDTIPGAEHLARQMMTYLFIKKDARYFKQLKNSTRQRFLNYVTNHPNMLQRVPQKILASYLDIKPETFSRLKHLLKDPKKEDK
ncbi:MAG: Crp/Fnr family transcriptional regulator [Flavitalea sp.]